MPNSTSGTTSKPNDLHISITTDSELRFWTKALDCTEEQMRAAIAIVGPKLKAVRKHLRATT